MGAGESHPREAYDVRDRAKDDAVIAMTDKERFLKYVTLGEPDACWEWQGARTKTGYGNNPAMTETRAHRMSWVLHKGQIPDGLHVLHKCDNPPCVNPNHLFLGTPKTNAEDRQQKGRTVIPRGSQCHTAILDEPKVSHIKLLIHQGLPTPEIALLFGVRSKVIRYIKTGVTWKHVEPMKEAA
jgi:HNH endonuclease